MIIDLLFIFFSSFTSLFIIRKAAKKIGLVDMPNHRKQHNGSIPIAGGIAICITLSNLLYSRPDLIPHSSLLLISIVVLTVVGAFDDRFDLNISFRIICQVILSVAFIHISPFKLDYLGNLFGFGDIYFDLFASCLMTTIAILGVINAFNMIDGLDGLLGTLSIVTFSSLGLLLNINGQVGLAYFCLIIVVTILPYVFMNLGYFGRKRKVFMGDAGSMMIGFISVWLLLHASQGAAETSINPATALWLIGLPIMDMTATIFRRLRRGKSAFHSDKDHIHYILQELGLSSTQTLFALCGGASVLAITGIMGEILYLSETVMFYSFFILFVLYALFINHLKKSIESNRKVTPPKID